MTPIEFLLARKNEEAESDIIAEASREAVEMQLTADEAMRWFEAFDRTYWAQSTRAQRAARNLGWALLSALAPFLVRREVQNYADHPDFNPSWRV